MGQRHINKINDYIQEAIENIRNDRSITETLLTDIIIEIKKSQSTYDSHRALGIIAAKYVETLQRSNEQLVKLAALLDKRISSKEELTEKDKNELFDLIQETA